MRTINKKTLIAICIVCLVTSLSVTMAITPLTINFGPVTVNPKPTANIIITSATWGETDGVVASGGQSVSFSGIPSMVVDESATVTITVHNNGGADGKITSAEIDGKSVFASTPYNTYPINIADGDSVTLSWLVTAEVEGTVSPICTIIWA